MSDSHETSTAGAFDPPTQVVDPPTEQHEGDDHNHADEDHEHEHEDAEGEGEGDEPLESEDHEHDEEDDDSAKKKKGSSKKSKKDKEGKRKGKKKRKSKRPGGGYLDVEVEVSSDEEISDDEDMDEDEDGILEDLIADEDEDIPQERRRRRKRKAKPIRLDDEDLELIKENTGQYVARDVDEDVIPDTEERAYRRLKKQRGDDDVFIPIVPLDEIHAHSQSASSELASSASSSSSRARHPHAISHEGKDYGPDPDADDEDYAEGDEGEEAEEGLYGAMGMGMGMGELGGLDGGRDRAKERLMDLFGDMSQFFQDQKVVPASVEESAPADPEEQKKRAQGLLKKLDPALQRTQFLTQTDDLIRSLDVPERLQTRYYKRVHREGEALELALVEEAQWIFRNAFMNPTGAVRKLSSDIIPMITQLLRYLRFDNLEMPFIQHYRREHYTTPNNTEMTLMPEELQAINEWDERWDMLDARKQKLIQTASDLGIDASKQVELEHIIRDASTESDLDDVQDFLTAYRASSAANSSLDLSQSQSQSQEDGGFRAPRRPRSSLVEDHDEFSQSTSAMLESVHLDENESSSSSSQQRRQKRGLRPSLTSDEERLVSQFALKPDELALNLQRGFKQHAPSDPDQLPESVARGYLDAMDEAERKKNFKLRSEEDVLMWMRQKAAQRLCEEPLLRRAVRDRFMSHCTVDTAPTPKGIREMDWLHEYFSVKRIEGKPVSKFSGEQFVLMTRAEDEGFIKIKFELGKGGQEELVNFLFKQYQSSNVSENAQRWNQQRRQILQEACSRYLWRLGEQHVRQHLLQRSREFITNQAKERLRDMASVAPYTPEQMLKDEKRPMRIVSIYLGEQTEPTYAVVLSKWGDVLDSLTLHFLKSRASANPEAPPGERASYAKKREDARRFQELLSHHQPLAIFIDASSTQAQRFRRDLEESVLGDFRHIRVEYSDPQIGRIFMNSERSQLEFKDYPKGLCHAISSGRYLLDPLAELCAMWYFDSESHSNELLALNLCKLQNAVPLEMMLKGLQQVLIEVVAAVGLDINKILQRPFLASEVQFVCGLGPRKAKALLDALRLRGHLANRHDLLATPIESVNAEGEVEFGGATTPLMGPVVFQNCAAFLQVRRNVAMEEKPGGRLQLLDSTRIHPESYKLAKQVVYDALDVDEDEEDKEAKDLPRDQLEEHRHERFTKHLQDLMERSASQLDELDLDAFAQMEEQSGRGKKLNTLYMIKAELAAPFDWHKVLKEWKPLTPERLFTLLTGENDETLREGMPMAVRIGRIRDDGAFCQLDSAELSGFVRWDRVSRDYPPDIAQNPPAREHWLKSVLQEGSTVQARVLRVNKERCRVELTCDPDDIKNSRLERTWIAKNISDKDPYFRGNYEHEDERRLLNAGNEQKDTKRYLPRNIIHPLFKNVGREEALAMLADRAPGEMVVRPATGSVDALTVTWKVHDDVYFDFRIQEKEKPNPYELGAQLIIDGQTYEDLDQIQATFVEPMSRYATKLIDSPKFRFGPEAELDQMLRTDKSHEPSRIAYCFSVSARHPGMFAFSYLSSRTIHREYVVATPRGYVLPTPRQQASIQPAPAKKQVYRSYEELVNALKQKIMRRDKEQQRMAPPPMPQMYHPGHGHGYAPPPHSAGAYSSRHGGSYYGSQGSGRYY